MGLTEVIDYGKDKKWLNILREPLQYSMIEKENAFNYARHNFMTIIKTNDVFELDIDSFIELFRSDDLNIDSEIKVFECVKQWIKLNNFNILDALGKLMQAVRLIFVPTKYLIDQILPYIWNVDECRAYFAEALHWKFSTDHKMDNERTRPRKIFSRPKHIMAISGNYVQMYSVDENKWQTAKSINIRKTGYGSYTLMNDRLIITGGYEGNSAISQVDEVDLSTRNVKSLANMKEPRMEHQLVTHGKGNAARIYALGGALRAQDTGIKTVERYDPTSNKWAYVSPMISPRHAFGAAVHGNDIFVIGGRSDGVYKKNIEVYHINEDKWESKAAMKQERYYSNAVIVKDMLYVIGGSSMQYRTGLLSSVERYDILNDSWNTIANISTHGLIGVCALNNSPVVIGGPQSDVMEIYDSEKNLWKKLASMEQKTVVHYAFLIPLELSHILHVWL